MKKIRKIKRFVALLLVVTFLPFGDLLTNVTVYGADETETTTQEIAVIEEESLKEELEPVETIILNGKISNDGSVYLNWEDSIGSYNVYKNSELLAEVTDTNYYMDTNVAAGETNHYSVEKVVDNQVVAQSEGVDIKEPEALNITGDYTLTENLTVYSLTQTNGTLNLNGYALNVCKDYKQTDGYLNFNTGALYCYGNYYLSRYGRVNMQNANDYFYIEGNVSWENCYSSYNVLTNGVMEVCGDFIQKSYASFMASQYHKVILSGTGTQTLSIPLGAYFNILELNNYSTQGVCSLNAVRYNSIIPNGSKLSIGDGDGIVGDTLNEDKTIDGDLNLVAGTLDLNGYTLTVTGNFIQSGGEVIINKGQLNIQGDYRMQVVKGENYSPSTGVLKMTEEEDLLVVKGDFYDASYQNHNGKLTAGIMEVEGNFYVSDYYNFMSTKGHKVLLNGTAKQTVTFNRYGTSYSQIANLEIANQSKEGVNFANPVYVSGVVTDNGNYTTGMIAISDSTTFAGNSFLGNVYVIAQKTIKGDLYIGGFVNNNSTIYVMGRLIINGNYIVSNSSSGLISMNKGNLTVYGDVIINQYNNKGIEMTHEEDYVFINGDAEISPYYSTSLTKGTLEIKGDLKTTGNFFASNSHKIILSGSEKQKVSFAENCYANSIELRNTSEEGVYFSNIISVREFIRNNSNVSICEMEGEYGWTLTEDTVYEGDLVLLCGNLDLNGHTLTVQGDFIHTGGNLTINHGVLKVEGDYRQQQRIINADESISYGSSNGLLIMTAEEDMMLVEGSYITNSVISSASFLTNGVLEIQGDFTVSTAGGNANSNYNFYATENHRVVLSGTKQQKVSFAVCTTNYSQIANLEITNDSEDGILFVNKPYVTGNVLDHKKNVSGYIAVGSNTVFADNSYNGSVHFLTSKTIDETLLIKGSAINSGSLNLNKGGEIGGEFQNNGSLTLESEMYIKGSVYNTNYLYVNGRLHVGGSMQNTSNIYVKDDIYIGGNYSVPYWTYGLVVMNKGRMTVNGNLTISHCTSFGIGMTHEEDYILINGDAEISPSYTTELTNGLMEIKGNIKSTGGFAPKGNHRILLSGEVKQEINLASGCGFNTLELKNTSKEGVNFINACNVNSLDKNDTRITVNNQEGELGTVLEEDRTVDGDYLLLCGVLDLNGHTMTVNGDLIHEAGTILVNNGTLVVTGDYRQQTRLKTDESCDYTYSNALLNMTQEQDCVSIKGSYITDSRINHNGYLTNGTLEVGGDFIVNFNHSYYNFYATENHTLILNGTKEQTIDFTNFSASGSRIRNLVSTNPNGIRVRDKYMVTGNVDTGGQSVTGQLALNGGTTFADGEYYGDIYIGYNFDYNADLHVYGSIYSAAYLTISKKLEVEGDFKHQTHNAKLTLNRGTVIVHRNLQMNINWYYYGLEMTHQEDYLLVYGNTSMSTYCSAKLTNGVMELKGDFTCSGGFIANGSHKVIFSGDKKQKISMNESDYFATVELQNYSDDGVVVSGILRKSSLIRNNCNLSYEGKEGVLGWTLTEDYVCEGDFVLLDDTLDLNGHTINITGDFIHAGGDLLLNGGKLIVNGDYRFQTRNGVEENYSYTRSTGHLVMKNEADYLMVGGNFYMQTSAAISSDITAGIIELKGNLTQTGDYAFVTSNTLLCTGVSQSITLTRDMQVASLVNNAEKSLELSRTIVVTGTVSDENGTACGNGYVNISDVGMLTNGIWGGNLRVTGNNTLTQALNVGKNLNITGSITLAGQEVYTTSMSIDGKLYVQDGIVTCTQNMSVNYNGQFIMQNAAGYVLVGGNFYIGSYYSHKGLLTDGILEIRGAFTQNSYGNFIATGNHRVILSRKRNSSGRNYIQSVSFTRNECRFHILELRKSDAEYQFQNTITDFADEIVYNNEDDTAPSAVTSLAAKSLAETSVTLAYAGAVDNTGIAGYEIYRDGSLVAVTSNLEYTDRGLAPETTHIYQVYPFDSYKNLAENSPKLEVITLADTKAPEEVNILSVKNRTGSAITITWNSVDDNVGTAGYHIYRNGEKIATVTDGCSYKDAGLVVNTMYRYTVSAFDEAGNCTEQGNIVTAQAVMPVITSVTPKDGTTYGKGILDLRAEFKNTGNSSGNRVKIEYKNNSDQWTMVSPTMLGQKTLNSGTLYVSYAWDVSNFAGRDEYTLRYTLYDEDGNTDVQETTCYIDNEAPKEPQNLKVQSREGNVYLTWEADESADCTAYRVYRREDGEYQLLETISGRYECSYMDKAVEAEGNYAYVITAVDLYGNESGYSEEQEILVLPDTQNPQVNEVYPKAGRIHDITGISVEASDNKKVATVTLFLKKEGEEDWTEWAVIEAAEGKAIYDLDTTELADGIYYINVKAADEVGNISEEDFTRRYEVDNTGIGKMEITDITCGSNSASIHWKDVEEEDFAYFMVEQLKDGAYQKIGKSTDTLGYHVSGLMSNTEYTFRVVAYDNLGNRGVESDPYTVITEEDTTVPAITAVYPVASSYKDTLNLKVAAKDNEAVAKAVFSYSLDNVNFTDIAEVKAGQNQANAELSYNFDLSNLPDGTLYIRFRVYDTSGNENAKTEDGKDIVVTYEVDTTPPGRVENPVVTGNEGYVSLDWDNAGTDISSYCIYRADMTTGIFRQINGACTTRNYYDTSVISGESYIYKVSAVDIAGNEGVCSREVSVTVAVDEEKPIITSMSPYTGSTVGANPQIKALAMDNAGLKKVSVQYRQSSNDSEIWTTIIEKNVSGRSALVDTTLPTDGLMEGAYEVRAVAEDAAGNQSQVFKVTYVLDMTPVEMPAIHAVSGNFAVDIQVEEIEASDFAYFELYRKSLTSDNYEKIASFQEHAYRDTVVEPNTIYLYQVIAYDTVGNKSESEVVSGYATDKDTVKPTAVLPENMTALTGLELALDGTGSIDNVRITQYSWDMGNGDILTGAKPVYTYEEAGTYLVKLTVYDAAGNKAETTTSITVMESTGNGIAAVQITDMDGAPIPYASVYMKISESENISYKADSTGMVTIGAVAGEYEVAAYDTGYLPESMAVKISEYENLNYTLKLEKGDVITGSLTVHRMELQEMIDAGVDFSNPENYNTYKFNLTLTLAQTPLPVEIEYIYNTGGFSGCYYGSYEGGSGGSAGSSGSTGTETGQKKTTVHVEEIKNEENVPVLAYISTTQEVSWLKDMYSVEAGIFNAADYQYVVEGSDITLNLPEGVSLAKTLQGQTETIELGDIHGQENKSASWVVKGDESGTYTLSADFNGTLMPFQRRITARFETESSFEVPSGEGIVIYMMPEDAAYIGESYYIRYRIENQSDRTFYNFTTSLGQGVGSREYLVADTQESGQGAIMEGGDRITISSFQPGDSYSGVLTMGFSAEGDAEEVYYKLINSTVTAIEGANTGVQVKVIPVSSHITKVIRKTEYVGFFGDPVDLATGAFTEEINAMSVYGTGELSFQATYNSGAASAKGTMGAGWTQCYESHIEEQNGVIYYYPYGKSVQGIFANEKALQDDAYATEEGQKIILSGNSTYSYGSYRPLSSGMTGYTLNKNMDGTYLVTTAGMDRYGYYADGTLAYMENEQGVRTTVDHMGNSDIITEQTSGKYLILTYDESGLITSVQDNAGRTAGFTYKDGMLTGYTDVCGNESAYTYDGQGHLLTAANAETTYVSNTYDESGRVTVQMDSLGNKKTFAYEDTVLEGTAGEPLLSTCVTVTDSDGSVKYLTANGAGEVTAITNGDGGTTTYTYDNRGNVLTETDALGGTLTRTYDSKGNITELKDVNGNVTTYSYDEKGNLTKSTDEAGNMTAYTYDEKGCLISTTDPSGDKTTWEYDGNGQMTKSICGDDETVMTYEGGRLKTQTDAMGNTINYNWDERGFLTTVTDALLNTTTYTYDNAGRTLTETDVDGTIRYTYDCNGNRLSQTDKLGNTTAYVYDTAGNLTETIYADGTCEKYTRDSVGNLTKTTYADGTAIILEYDTAKNLVKKIHTDGSVEHYTYDLLGRCTKAVDAEGYETRYQYLADGKIQKITYSDAGTVTYEYDVTGRLAGETDGEGNVTTYAYDAEGNLISRTNGEGEKTTYTYDKNGNCTSQTDGNGNITIYTYNAVNCLIKTTYADGSEYHMEYDSMGRMTKAYTLADGEEYAATYTYDGAGRVLTSTDEEGNTVSYTYDGEGNVLTITDALGNVTARNTIDAMGRVTETTDALGNAASCSYDLSGRLVSRVEYLNTESERKASFTYDSAGNLSATVDALDGRVSTEYNKVGDVTQVTDPTGNITKYSYDMPGRTASEQDGLGHETAYSYNKNGRIRKITDAAGRDTTYTYDGAGRVLTMTDELGTVTCEYDGTGNLIKTRDEKGSIGRTYDSRNRVTEYTDYRGNTVTYGYDQLGNIVTLTYAGGEIIRCGYYKNGLIKSVSYGDDVTTYEYDGNGRLTKTTRADGSIEIRSYNAAGRLLTIQDSGADGTGINNLSYTYSTNGTMAGITGSRNTGTGHGKLNTAIMTYDEAGRLAAYNGEEVLYDDCGNMTYGPVDGVMKELTYDCRNRLVQAGDTVYVYDCENNRIGKTTEKETTEYMVETVSSVFSRVLSAATTENGSATETIYVYGNGLISQETDGEKLYYHYNHLGSATALTNETGKIVYEYTYGTYGELLSGDTDITPYLYNGQYGVSTDGNGLYYMRSRYYSTDIKRFINRDVVRGSLTNSRSLNRYCYVQGNPVSCADPFGMSPYNFQFVEAHGVLDVLGIIPGLGDIATLANAGLYAMEGRTGEAVKYLAVAAAIGGGVYAAGKAVTKAAGTAGKIAKAKSTAKNFTNSVKSTAKELAEDNRGCVDFGRKGGKGSVKVDELVIRDSRYLNADGKIDWDKWAPNGGRVPGTIKDGQTLSAGTIIDRYGNKYGKYTSPVGAPYEQRALPYVENPNAYHKYEVVKPIDNVTISEIAAAFEQPGGGIQYELPSNIKQLLKDGYIKEIFK